MKLIGLLDLLKISLLIPLSGLFVSCHVAERISHKIKVVNNYEAVALNLARENRLLQSKVAELEYQIQTLEARNNFLQIKLEEKEGQQVKREIASIPEEVELENDLVKFSTYKWNPKQLLSIAENEFEQKNFEKAAQFFYTYVNKHGTEAEKVDTRFDTTLFQAGVSAYESGNHYDWCLNFLNQLIKKYPSSSHYRGAKLWIGLSHMRRGEQEEFYKILEEFRIKYRNTPEWKILSGHYEEFVQKFKK